MYYVLMNDTSGALCISASRPGTREPWLRVLLACETISDARWSLPKYRI